MACLSLNGWLPELRSLRTLFQRIVHASRVCQLCGTCSVHSTLLRATATARRGWKDGDCWCRSSGLNTGNSTAPHSGLLAAFVGMKKVPGEPIPQPCQRKPSAVARDLTAASAGCGKVLPTALQLVLSMGKASEEGAVAGHAGGQGPCPGISSPEHLR